MKPSTKRHEKNQFEVKASNIDTQENTEHKVNSIHSSVKRLKELQDLSHIDEQIYENNLLLQAGKELPMFIYTPQGKESYLDPKTPSHILGSYTDGFTTCNILVIVSKGGDGICTSLSHIDERYLPSFVEKSINAMEEVGAIHAIYIYKRKNAVSDERFEKLIKPNLGNHKYHLENVDDDIMGISVDREGNIKKYGRRLTNLLTCPYHYQLKLVRQIHEGLVHGAQITQQPLIYNTKDWEKPTKTDNVLCPHTKEIIDNLSIKPDTPYGEICIKLIRFYSKNPHYIGLNSVTDFERELPSIAHFIKYRAKCIHKFINIHNPHYEKMFIQNISFILLQYKALVVMPEEISFLSRLEGILNKGSDCHTEVINLIINADKLILENLRSLIDDLIDCIDIRSSWESHLKFTEAMDILLKREGLVFKIQDVIANNFIKRLELMLGKKMVLIVSNSVLFSTSWLKQLKSDNPAAIEELACGLGVPKNTLQI